jgi:hypothetical protein
MMKNNGLFTSVEEINALPEERIVVSNKTNIDNDYSEYIRKQMVKFVNDTVNRLSMVENEQYSNS